MLFEKRVDEEHRPHTPHGNVERTVPEAGPHDPEEVPFLAEALTMRRHSPPYVRGTPNRGIEQDRNSKVTRPHTQPRAILSGLWAHLPSSSLPPARANDASGPPKGASLAPHPPCVSGPLDMSFRGRIDGAGFVSRGLGKPRAGDLAVTRRERPLGPNAVPRTSQRRNALHR